LAERLDAAYRSTAANLPKNAAVHVDGTELGSRHGTGRIAR
jgi:hypothetical protein